MKYPVVRNGGAGVQRRACREGETAAVVPAALVEDHDAGVDVDGARDRDQLLDGDRVVPEGRRGVDECGPTCREVAREYSDAAKEIEDNAAARLLTRPGEAIYNDANGLFEGNHPFQVVWLSDQQREGYLQRLAETERWMRERYGPAAPESKGTKLYWRNDFLWAAAFLPSEAGRCSH